MEGPMNQTIATQAMPKIHRPDEQKHIYLDNLEDLRTWCSYFEVPRNHLIEALETVGSFAADVHDFLKAKGQLKFK